MIAYWDIGWVAKLIGVVPWAFVQILSELFSSLEIEIMKELSSLNKVSIFKCEVLLLIS